MERLTTGMAVKAIRMGVLAGVLLAACAGGSDGLDALHADIASDYPGVTHVSTREVAAMNDVVLLDIREPDEFAVSRLPGAVQVGLGEEPDAVLSRLPDLKGRHVVAYCSVGRRSSIFAERMEAALREAGAASVSNMQGGVFRWHGDKRPLVDDGGATDAVHPYDEVWKRYVVRKEGAAYAPE